MTAGSPPCQNEGAVRKPAATLFIVLALLAATAFFLWRTLPPVPAPRPPGGTDTPLPPWPSGATAPVTLVDSIPFTGTGEVALTAEVQLTAEVPLAAPPDEPETIEPAKPPERVDELRLPKGFRRIEAGRGSFARYIQTLPLKKSAEILTWTGQPLSRRYYDVLAVVDKPLLFKQDLEQCADYAMRFWADWHLDSGRLEPRHGAEPARGADRLHLYEYSGAKRPFKGTVKDYPAFLRRAFAASNSHSLKQGLARVEAADLRPGDLVVQNDTGGIGHVSVVVDACENAAGKRLYLFGFSFMPAQEFHVERARKPYGAGGWFSLNGYFDFLARYFPYGKPVLRRFE